ALVDPKHQVEKTPAAPIWSCATATPLHGMCPHPTIKGGPFLGVSATLRALQVLPSPPNKALPATLQAPKTLCTVDTLEAHQKGATVMATSPDGSFVATGGADGLLCLWAVYEQGVELLHTALVHGG
ncbi:unnamed protein product, partial [Chrysoparadoxa australica]